MIAPPAAALVADRDRAAGRDVERCSAAAIAASIAAWARSRNHDQHSGDRPPSRAAQRDDDKLIADVRPDADDARATRAGAASTIRQLAQPSAAAADRRSRRLGRCSRATTAARSRAIASTWRRSHDSRSRRKRSTSASGWAQPRRVAGGTVTTTPSAGSIVTRSRRDRGERRRVYGGSGPVIGADRATSRGCRDASADAGRRAVPTASSSSVEAAARPSPSTAIAPRARSPRARPRRPRRTRRPSSGDRPGRRPREWRRRPSRCPAARRRSR